MLTLGIAGLLAAYVLVALLLLSVNLYSDWSWQVKAGTIIATTLFYAVTYLSFPPLLGWPTGEAPPQRFRLVAADVLQPDKATGAAGKIFLWLKDLDDLSARARPRAYELPYSGALHERVTQAQVKLEKGMQQLGEIKPPEEGNRSRVDRLTRTVEQAVNIEFFDLPDPLIPDK